MSHQTPITGPTIRLQTTCWRAFLWCRISLVAVFAILLLHRPTPISLPLTVPPPPQVCSERNRRQIDGLLAAGHWEQAQAAADRLLLQYPACSTSLADQYRHAALESLLATQVAPGDTPAQDALATRYIQLRTRLGHLPLNNLQVARRAYDTQKFALALAAFDWAWREGRFGEHDRALVQMYTSSLHNRAAWQLSNSAYRTNALRLLVASVCIARMYALSANSSTELLAQQLSPDPRVWPTPLTNPVLERRPCPLPT